MKVVLISDTHNQHERLNLPPGDIIIHAGDITGSGTPRETLNFFQWFSSLPYTNKVFIAGNHDFAFENKSVSIPEGVRTY